MTFILTSNKSCGFGYNLKRCKHHGRRTKSVNIGDKNPRKSEAEKSAIFDSVKNASKVRNLSSLPWSSEDSHGLDFKAIEMLRLYKSIREFLFFTGRNP